MRTVPAHLTHQSQSRHGQVNISRLVSMFCPTAVDQFFMTKLSQMDLNMNKQNKTSYRQRVQLVDRRREARESITRYPTKIPLVIEKHRTEKSVQDIDKVGRI